MADRVKQLIKNRSIRENKSEDEILGNIVNNIPLKRITKPEEVGYLVTFLIDMHHISIVHQYL